MRSLCQSAEEYSISCLDAHTSFKALIKCKNGYYNDRNITEQTIICMENGEWSDEPMKCIAKCIEVDNLFDLIQDLSGGLDFDQLKHIDNKSLIEVNRRSTSVKEISRFFGLIISEREVVIKCNYLHNDTFEHFTIRIENINREIENIKRILEVDTELCILSLNSSYYIKYNETIMPACNNFTLSDDVKPRHGYGMEKMNSEQYLPILSRGCFVQFPTGSNIEYQCFNSKQSSLKTTFEQTECSIHADKVIKRCPIGYENKNFNQKGNDRLDFCEDNKWLNESGDDNKCTLVCGDNRQPSCSRCDGPPVDVLTSPWHVGIYANYSTRTFQQICGGTIIHSNIIISAGHCFNKAHHLSSYLVGAGKRLRSFDINEPYEYYSGIKELHIPSSYESSPVRNDIAVLVLNDNLKYSAYIKPICIKWESYYKNYNMEKGIKGRAVGFGSTSKDDIPSVELYEINFETIGNEECKKIVEPNFEAEITYDRFCAKSDEMSVACRGDSGGGFQIQKFHESVKRYFLAGVVSVALGEESYCTNGSYTALTNIQYYQDFIKSIVSESRNSFNNLKSVESNQDL